MQNRRRPRKKSYKKKGGNSRSAIILIILALGLTTLIYYLSKPVSETIKPTRQTAAKKESKKKVLQKEAEEEKAKTVEEEKEPVKPLDEMKDATSSVKPPDKIKKTIYDAAIKLGVEEGKIKAKDKPDGLHILIPLDRDVLDLTFANMILKGEVTRAGGAFISGKEDAKHNMQILTFRDNQGGKNYIAELYYDKALEVKIKRKQLAVIIDDFGNYNGPLLHDFAATNHAVTFAIMPDTKYSKDALNAAKANGHECIIHIPMEPLDYPKSNPGPHAIYVQLSQKEIEKRMEDYIHELPGCVGANNHMGSFASSDVAVMQAVMRVLKRYNMYFVDSRTTSESVAFNVAQKSLVPAYKRDLFIDEPKPTEENLRKQLANLQSLRASQDYAVVIMHCHSRDYLNYLNRFLKSAVALGFDLVPVSKLQSRVLPQIP